MLLRTFSGSIVVTALALGGGYWAGGPTVVALVAILAVLEVSLSFDNAVINASVLARMSRFWQRIFLTVGVAIAVFGMRLAFPFILVSATARLSPTAVFDLATRHPDVYQQHLRAAHPAIAAFGGVFLLMIFLDFVFEDHEIKWLAPVERALGRIGKLDQLSVVIALVTITVAAEALSPHPLTVLLAGSAGLVTYILVNSVGELFSAGAAADAGDAGAAGEGESGVTLAPGRGGSAVTLAVGKAAFLLFLYIELLDASFSFDGVAGAFAVSSDPFVIALGLGVGAMYVRSLTVHLVRQGTLQEYVYLEHGAHWAIGALAVILLISMKYHINEIVTGLAGVLCILAAFVSSIVRNRRAERDRPVDPAPDVAKRQLAQV